MEFGLILMILFTLFFVVLFLESYRNLSNTLRVEDFVTTMLRVGEKHRAEEYLDELEPVKDEVKSKPPKPFRAWI